MQRGTRYVCSPVFGLVGFTLALLLCGCEDARKAAEAGADEVTGARVIRQGREIEKQLKQIEADRNQPFRELAE